MRSRRIWSWITIVLSASLLLTLILGSRAFANGGPADTVPYVSGGGIHFIQKKNVSLIREDLAFVITGDQVQVGVTYTLVNRGKADRVAFAFPVDFYEQEYGCVPECDFQPSGFKILDNGKPLKLTNELKKEPIGKIIDEKYITQKVSRIYKTNISFAKKETKVIKVNYTVDAGYVDWMDPYSFIDRMGERQFSYDLTPAGYWGDGKVDKLTILVDYRDIVKKGGSLLKLTFPYGQASSEGLFKAELTEADLKSLGEIRFQYEYENYLRSNQIKASRMSSKRVASVKASSQLGESYSVRNLLDNRVSTAWVEGAKDLGAGETITIQLKEGTTLAELRLMNGYLKSKQTYENNARIRSLHVESLVKYPSAENYEWISHDVHFEDKPYNAEAIRNGDYYSLSDKVSYYEGEVKTIKLTLLDTYSGMKYEDTCISELLLLNWM